MRFEVPQFIEVEDKVVGPFTWKQFVYLAGGGGLLVILFLKLPFFIFVMFGVPLGALSAFLAFHKINNRPFSIFLESFVNYMTRGKLYLWHKDATYTHEENMPVTETQPLTAPTPGSSPRLSTLAEKLEFYSLEK